MFIDQFIQKFASSQLPPGKSPDDASDFSDYSSQAIFGQQLGAASNRDYRFASRFEDTAYLGNRLFGVGKVTQSL
jgi:hypothetical protein